MFLFLPCIHSFGRGLVVIYEIRCCRCRESGAWDAAVLLKGSFRILGFPAEASL